jgi:NADP-dependent 3-hydroxy acid dehydrogenase YdfG
LRSTTGEGVGVVSGSLAGKVAVVTGASSGIGEGIAAVLARAGAAVTATARRADRLDNLVARIEAEGGTALALPGDAADEPFATEVIDETIRRFGRLDILVNSAGVLQGGGVESAPTSEWRRNVDVNLMATLYTCKAAIPPMRAQGGGDIVNVTSHAARVAGAASMAPYVTSKRAVTALTEGLRQEVGGYGIRVCNIEPGAVTTEISEQITDPQIRAGIWQYLTQEGAMTGEDVGDIVLFVLNLPRRVNISEMLFRPTKDTMGL